MNNDMMNLLERAVEALERIAGALHHKGLNMSLVDLVSTADDNLSQIAVALESDRGTTVGESLVSILNCMP